MNINITYDSSAAGAPSYFTNTVNSVVSLLDSLFLNAASVNITVGWGSVNGTALPANDIGSSLSYYGTTDYSTAKNAILNTDSNWHSDNPSLVPTMQTTYPVSNASIAVFSADAKALGLMGPSSSTDGYVGFSSTADWAPNENGAIKATQYDLFSTVIHEITEVMGRISDVGVHGYDTAMDLFRYSSPGTLDTTTGGLNSTAYFSTDGGTTHLGTWNNDPSNGDTGDWFPNGPGVGGIDAANDFATQGQFEPLSQVDLTLMDALGWNTLKHNVAVTDQTLGGQAVAVPVTLYAGPVAGLNFQYIYTGADNINVTATASNEFVHTGAGEDAINFQNVTGNNVLDGGTGSNFLVGTTNAASQDTFFLDARNVAADIWSTVVNLHKGDAITLWGYTAANALNWVDGQGAAGFTGLTSHSPFNGHTASLTLVGLTTADLNNGHLSFNYGTDVNGNHYLQFVDLV